MLPTLCACCVARCLQKPFDFHEELEDHGQNVNFIAEHTLFMLRAESVDVIGISDKQLEVSAPRLKVRASMLMSATAIDSVPVPLARGHAHKAPPQQLTLSSHERCASARPPRWQDASFCW